MSWLRTKNKQGRTHTGGRFAARWLLQLAVMLLLTAWGTTWASDEFTDAVSREVSICFGADAYLAFPDASSREVSVYVGSDAGVAFSDATSREVSVYVGSDAGVAFGDATSREVSVYVGSDAGIAFADAISREVDVFNNPVSIAFIPDVHIPENAAYTSPTPSLRYGKLPVAWALVAGPDGLTMPDTATGVVTWPNPTMTGSPFTVTISATNSESSDQRSYKIYVEQIPAIEPIPDASIRGGEGAYTGPTPHLLGGSTPITWTLIASPAGMTLNASTGVVYWADPTDEGSPFTITIRATNAVGSSDATWHVGIGAPPIIADILDQTAAENAIYTGLTPVLQRSAPLVTWSLMTGPAGMTIDAATGIVSWPNAVAAATAYTITIRASDANGSACKTWHLSVPITYTATVLADIHTAPAGTPITLRGQAVRLDNGAAVSNAQVTLRIRTQGTRRVIQALTDGAGQFLAVFHPLSGEAGRYEVGADHPAVTADKTDDAFTLYGMSVEPSQASCTLPTGGQISGQVQVRNLGDVALSGIHATVTGATADVQVDVTVPDQLASLGTGTLGYTVTSLGIDGLSGTVHVNLTSAEGAAATLTLAIEVQEPAPQVVLIGSSPLAAGMLIGKTTLVQFELANTGGAASDTLAIQLPYAPWLSLASPTAVDSIPPGGKAAVVLRLTPAADLNPGTYNGTLVVSGPTTDLSIPFAFTAVSDGIGNLQVTAEDEASYFGAAHPKLAGASVTVTKAADGTVVATGTTGPAGAIVFPGLTEAYYNIEVTADKHGGFQTTVLVRAGQTSEVLAFLPAQQVSYTWTVVPTEVPDEYTIQIDAAFETQVPAPVVTIDPPLVDLNLIGAEAQVDFTVTNHGWIAAQDARMVWQSSDRYEIVPLIVTLGDIPAHGTVVVPVLIRDKALAGQMPANADPCGEVSLAVQYSYTCDKVYTRLVPVRFLAPRGECDQPVWNVSGQSTGIAAPTLSQPNQYEQPVSCDPSHPEQGVCVRVKIQIDQQAIISRAGFKATLELQDIGTDPLDGVQVSLDIRDADHNPAGDRFGVSAPQLTNISDVTGSGSVPAGQTAAAEWTLLSTDQAAPTAPAKYYVGGTLQYTLAGQLITIPLYPAEITVLPNPKLHLKYFLERTVYSDDPFTTLVEPAIPFSLGLIMSNSGAGVANNIRITSSEPKIVENVSGLQIDFDIVGTKVGGQAISPSLTVNLGDIGPGGSAVAQWLMTSSLQGKFIDYSATFQHVSALGADQLSLIDSVEILPMTHVVRVDVPVDDGLPDFLVMDPAVPDSLPNALHTSDGRVLPVTAVTDGTVDAPPAVGHIQVQLTAAMTAGWVYLRINDPAVSASQYRLEGVLRSDGRLLRMGDNVWTTHRIVRPQGQPSYSEDFLHLVDVDSTGSYTLVYTTIHPPLSPLIGAATATTITLLDVGSTYPDDVEHAVQDAITGKYVGASGRLQINAFWQSAAAWRNFLIWGLSPWTEYHLQAKARPAGNETPFGPFATAATSVGGDIEGDGAVDVVDLLYLVDSFGRSQGQPRYDPRCDFNGDGHVDVVDLLTLIECWPE